MSFFSVVIPLYNKENFIEKTLQSVFNQSFTDYELIIVNDCSTDKSVEVISKLNDEKIQLVNHKVNKGLSASRNTGIKNSNSKYIAFLDADDLWKPTFLEEIHLLIEKYKEASLFATNYEEIINEKETILPSNGADKLQENSLIDDYFDIGILQPLYNQSCFCVEKSVFDKIGYYDEKITFGEDIDFNIRANLEFKLAYSKKPLSQYITISENQITQSNLSSKTITDFDFYEKKFPNNKSLKKYLDFNRYIMAKHYKLEGNFEKYNKMESEIDWSNLNWKQKILLHLPISFLKMIKNIKLFILRKGIRITTYN